MRLYEVSERNASARLVGELSASLSSLTRGPNNLLYGVDYDSGAGSVGARIESDNVVIDGSDLSSGGVLPYGEPRAIAVDDEGNRFWPYHGDWGGAYIAPNGIIYLGAVSSSQLVLAFNPDGTRASGSGTNIADFADGSELTSVKPYLQGAWSDGTTIWIAGGNIGKLYAFSAESTAREPARDIDVFTPTALDMLPTDMAAADLSVVGVCGLGTVLYAIVQDVKANSRAYAIPYDIPTRARIMGRDVAFAQTSSFVMRPFKWFFIDGANAWFDNKGGAGENTFRRLPFPALNPAGATGDMPTSAVAALPVAARTDTPLRLSQTYQTDDYIYFTAHETGRTTESLFRWDKANDRLDTAWVPYSVGNQERLDDRFTTANGLGIDETNEAAWVCNPNVVNGGGHFSIFNFQAAGRHARIDEIVTGSRYEMVFALVGTSIYVIGRNQRNRNIWRYDYDTSANTISYNRNGSFRNNGTLAGYGGPITYLISDGTTLWCRVAADDKWYAWSISSHSPDSAKDVTAADLHGPGDHLHDGKYYKLVVDNAGTFGFEAYSWPAGTRDSASDITLGSESSFYSGGASKSGNRIYLPIEDGLEAEDLAAGIITKNDAASFTSAQLSDAPNAKGVYYDGTTIWLTTGAKVVAYTASSKARDSTKDIDDSNFAAAAILGGITSDGTTIWVTDTNNNEVRAFVKSTLARDSGKDITAGLPEGAGVDMDVSGNTLYIADENGVALYGYNISGAAPTRHSAAVERSLIAGFKGQSASRLLDADYDEDSTGVGVLSAVDSANVYRFHTKTGVLVEKVTPDNLGVGTIRGVMSHPTTSLNILYLLTEIANSVALRAYQAGYTRAVPNRISAAASGDVGPVGMNLTRPSGAAYGAFSLTDSRLAVMYAGGAWIDATLSALAYRVYDIPNFLGDNLQKTIGVFVTAETAYLATVSPTGASRIVYAYDLLTGQQDASKTIRTVGIAQAIWSDGRIMHVFEIASLSEGATIPAAIRAYDMSDGSNIPEMTISDADFRSIGNLETYRVISTLEIGTKRQSNILFGAEDLIWAGYSSQADVQVNVAQQGSSRVFCWNRRTNARVPNLDFSVGNYRLPAGIATPYQWIGTGQEAPNHQSILPGPIVYYRRRIFLFGLAGGANVRRGSPSTSNIIATAAALAPGVSKMKSVDPLTARIGDYAETTLGIVSGLAYDATSQLFYMIDEGTGVLHSVTHAGAQSSVGDTGLFGVQGLAHVGFDDLLACVGQNIYKVNRLSASSELIGRVGVPLTGLTYQEDVLYGITPNSLYRIDIENGIPTLVGRMPIRTGAGVAATMLTFSVGDARLPGKPPEPTFPYPYVGGLRINIQHPEDSGGASLVNWHIYLRPKVPANSAFVRHILPVEDVEDLSLVWPFRLEVDGVYECQYALETEKGIGLFSDIGEVTVYDYPGQTIESFGLGLSGSSFYGHWMVGDTGGTTPIIEHAFEWQIKGSRAWNFVVFTPTELTSAATALAAAIADVDDIPAGYKTDETGYIVTDNVIEDATYVLRSRVRNIIGWGNYGLEVEAVAEEEESTEPTMRPTIPKSIDFDKITYRQSDALLARLEDDRPTDEDRKDNKAAEYDIELHRYTEGAALTNATRITSVVIDATSVGPISHNLSSPIPNLASYLIRGYGALDQRDGVIGVSRVWLHNGTTINIVKDSAFVVRGRARNDIGNSAWVVSRPITIEGEEIDPIDTITDLAFVAGSPDDTAGNLEFTEPNPAASIESYNMRSWDGDTPSGDGALTAVVNGANRKRTIPVTGLVIGRKKSWQLRANHTDDDAPEADWSNTASYTPMGAPVDLSVTGALVYTIDKVWLQDGTSRNRRTDEYRTDAGMDLRKVYVRYSNTVGETDRDFKTMEVTFEQSSSSGGTYIAVGTITNAVANSGSQALSQLYVRATFRAVDGNGNKGQAQIINVVRPRVPLAPTITAAAVEFISGTSGPRQSSITIDPADEDKTFVGNNPDNQYTASRVNWETDTQRGVVTDDDADLVIKVPTSEDSTAESFEFKASMKNKVGYGARSAGRSVDTGGDDDGGNGDGGNGDGGNGDGGNGDGGNGDGGNGDGGNGDGGNGDGGNGDGGNGDGGGNGNGGGGTTEIETGLVHTFRIPAADSITGFTMYGNRWVIMNSHGRKPGGIGRALFYRTLIEIRSSAGAFGYNRISNSPWERRAATVFRQSAIVDMGSGSTGTWYSMRGFTDIPPNQIPREMRTLVNYQDSPRSANAIDFLMVSPIIWRGDDGNMYAAYEWKSVGQSSQILNYYRVRLPLTGAFARVFQNRGGGGANSGSLFYTVQLPSFQGLLTGSSYLTLGGGYSGQGVVEYNGFTYVVLVAIGSGTSRIRRVRTSDSSGLNASDFSDVYLLPRAHRLRALCTNRGSPGAGVYALIDTGSAPQNQRTIEVRKIA